MLSASPIVFSLVITAIISMMLETAVKDSEMGDSLGSLMGVISISSIILAALGVIKVI